MRLFRQIILGAFVIALVISLAGIRAANAGLIDANFLIEASFPIGPNDAATLLQPFPGSGERSQTEMTPNGQTTLNQIHWNATPDRVQFDYTLSLSPGEDPVGFFRAGLTSLTFSVDAPTAYVIGGDFALQEGGVDYLYWRTRIRNPSGLAPPESPVAVPFDQIRSGTDLENIRFGTRSPGDSLVSGSPDGFFQPGVRYTLDLSATLTGLQTRSLTEEATVRGSFSLTLVPEPTSALTVGLGLAWLGLRRRRS